MSEPGEREPSEVSVSLETGPELGSLPSPTAKPEDAAPQGAPADAELPNGYLIDGKYRIDRVVGQGGMGTVYLARHLALEEAVAIKVLRPLMMQMPGMVTRFVREARAASKIKSEHVARVSDVDTLPSGVPYIVMEFLQGIDLAALRRKVGPLPIAEAATHIGQACDAIAEAHSLGIVHRDLKPGNLFLAERRDDRRLVKVLDFGISKVESPQDQDSTSTGVTMGSPKYMSPEQMRSLRDVDGRTDIWALGAILYDLLAGRPPFLADTMAQVCTLVLHGEPPPLRSLRPEVPAELDAIVKRCLRKARTERFASADDLARALSPFCVPGAVKVSASSRLSLPSVSVELDPAPLAGSPTLPLDKVSPPPASSSGALPTWDAPAPAPRRGRTAAVGLLAVAALVAAGGGVLLMARGAGEPAAAQASDAPAAAAMGGRAPAEVLSGEPGAPGARGAPAASGAPASADRVAGAAPASVATVSAAASSAAPPARAPLRPAGSAAPRKPSKPADPFGGSRN